MRLEFADFVLDTVRGELLQGKEAVTAEPQVFKLLVYLVENRDRIVSKDELIDSVWDGRIVSDATLNSRINSLRRALDDDGKAQSLIRTFSKRGYRFVADVRQTDAAQNNGSAAAAEASNRHVSVQDQSVRFCITPDGVRIAYATVGQGPPIVSVGHWVTHLELEWDVATRREMFEVLAENRTLVRYDARGNGLSDWEVERISFEDFVSDLTCVIDELGLDRFALLGRSQGAAVAAAYAARYPEKVSRLILYGGFARGRRKRNSASQLAESDAFVTLIRDGWGNENPAYVQMFGSFFMPDASQEQLAMFTKLQRLTTNPENAARIRYAIDDLDISEEIKAIEAPTLVLHASQDAMVPFDEGRRMAASIPGARFVQLDSRNHSTLPNEPAWQRFLDEISKFLTA